jgi:ABC-type antimicrobial peptide transport system permease subunit
MSLVIAKVLRYPVTVSGPELPVAFAASALSVIAAGIYPSFKATQIYPVDIIREIYGGKAGISSFPRSSVGTITLLP